jgi:TolA-binding protein
MVCKPNRGFWRSFSLRVLLLAAFLFGVMTLPLAAQQSASSPPTNALSTMPSTQVLTLLLQADAKLTELNRQIPILQQQISDLQEALQTLDEQTKSDSVSRQKQLQDLQGKLTESEKARAVLQSWLVALKTTYDAQSLAFQDLQQQATTVIGDYEAALAGERAQKLGWQIGGITLGAAVVAVGGYELGHWLKLW